MIPAQQEPSLHPWPRMTESAGSTSQLIAHFEKSGLDALSSPVADLFAETGVDTWPEPDEGNHPSSILVKDAQKLHETVR